MTRTRCSAAADWQNHNAAEWKGRRHGATAFNAKASKCNCTKKPPKNRFIHLQVRCTLHGSFKLHKKMSTPWEVHCHDDVSAVLQASVRLQFVPILKRSCRDICIKWRAPYNLWRPGLNSRALLEQQSSVMCRMHTCDWRPWLHFGGLAGQVVAFSSHERHYSRRLTHSCELPHYRKRPLCR